jgi:hypothetical protein
VVSDESECAGVNNMPVLYAGVNNVPVRYAGVNNVSVQYACANNVSVRYACANNVPVRYAGVKILRRGMLVLIIFPMGMPVSKCSGAVSL